jgi:hypothetical protein
VMMIMMLTMVILKTLVIPQRTHSDGLHNDGVPL